LLAVRTMHVSMLLIFGVVAADLTASEPLEDLLSATFRITDGDHSGTCFIISDEALKSSDPRRVVLATAAHVLAQMSHSKCDLILRTATAENEFQRKSFPIEIRDGDKPRWSRLPEVDIATMRVTLPDDVDVKPIALSQIATKDAFKDRTVKVGQEAWIGCFPAKLEANDAGWPILRKGSIASYPLVPVKSAKTMMIDYNVFPGDSGAPVAVIVDDRPLIVGVASGMQRQTDRTTLPFEERTTHTPLGLSIAVQSSYLRQTIDLMTDQ
jgi:hypothetical protein